MPGEKRSWKVFCLDIMKQIITSLFAHFMNLALAVYLQKVTNEGNGCVWYFTNHVLDCFIGTVLAYVMFRIVDNVAVHYHIEELKSGVYMDESVNVLSENQGGQKLDKNLNYKIWFLQVFVWCIITLISKIIVFFFELFQHKILCAFGSFALSFVENDPKLELVTVMIIFPLTLNSA